MQDSRRKVRVREEIKLMRKVCDGLEKYLRVRGTILNQHVSVESLLKVHAQYNHYR